MDNTHKEYKEEIYEFGEAINRLDEIKSEIEILVEEAGRIIRRKIGRDDLIYRRADAYWIPIINKTLANEMEYGTIESTIIEMEKWLEEMKENK